MSEEQLHKYVVWITELESRQQTLATSRARYTRFFVGVIPISCLGFVWNTWVGVGSLLTGVMCCVFGLYVMAVRSREYERELAQARKTATALRTSDAARAMTAD